MVEQGSSSLSADEHGRILDRLAGMEKIILPELVERALASTGKKSTRRCSLTNTVMLWVVLAMGLFTEMPIRQVFKVSRRLRKDEASPARSSLCMARQRLGSEPLVELHPQRTGHDEVHRIMTNLFDAKEYPAMELVLEYHERWEEEMVFDEQKTHQDPCRAEKTTNLRSETSDGLKQELCVVARSLYNSCDDARGRQEQKHRC